MKQAIDDAEIADVAELVKGRLGVVIHTRATDGQPVRGPLTAQDVSDLQAGRVVPGVSAPRLWDELSEQGVPTGRKVVYLEEDTAAAIDDDTEVTRLGLDPTRVQSMRARRRELPARAAARGRK